jgi:hypothetical protein
MDMNMSLIRKLEACVILEDISKLDDLIQSDYEKTKNYLTNLLYWSISGGHLQVVQHILEKYKNMLNKNEHENDIKHMFSIAYNSAEINIMQALLLAFPWIADEEFKKNYFAEQPQLLDYLLKKMKTK